MDFIAAKHQKNLDGTQSILSMKEDVHDRLLALAKPRNKFPALHKINDYYSDATILFGELNLLRDELNKILKTSAKKDKEIEEFLQFINSSIAEKNNIYVTAD